MGGRKWLELYAVATRTPIARKSPAICFLVVRSSSNRRVRRLHRCALLRSVRRLRSRPLTSRINWPPWRTRKGKPIDAPADTPDIKIEQGGRDMPEFHPILTTDYFEYGTMANRLDKEGAAVEMGDAALGLACSELADPPNWAVIRNMSDPVINGDLPAKEFHLNEQTTWAVGYYTAYGQYTSICGALATWAVIAGLGN